MFSADVITSGSMNLYKLFGMDQAGSFILIIYQLLQQTMLQEILWGLCIDFSIAL